MYEAFIKIINYTIGLKNNVKFLKKWLNKKLFYTLFQELYCSYYQLNLFSYT